MEMPEPESRRDSLEASLNDSIMEEIPFNNEVSFNNDIPFSNDMLNATLDLSQVSGWSALTPGWNDSFKVPLVESESEEASDRVIQQNQEQERLALKTSLHDLFIENCCTLYNDIQNAIDELEFVEQLQCFESLESRQNRLMEQAKLLAESAPDLADIVQLRIQTLNRAMEHLRIKHGNDSARSNSSKGNYGPSHQLRKWLQSVESQLDKFRSEIHSEQGSTVGGLQRLAADHQVLQLRIETEGQSLLSAAKKQIQLGYVFYIRREKTGSNQKELGAVGTKAIFFLAQKSGKP
ncbi:hypothetical protein FO519_004181 [Halicephalobus sp. NKZ332]|nr:hypothetical protein FO519_004181 [Halicephalobus sp. NKZ332]